MKKIIISLAVIMATAAAVAGATTAFYGDEEVSTDNVFTAGGVDLKVDSTAHYNGMVCTCPTGGSCTWQPGAGAVQPYYPPTGSPCDGTWAQTDLGAYKFFKLDDVKPGDSGENTVSLHVVANDAWGKFNIKNVRDQGVTCADPETEMANDADCHNQIPGIAEADGELRENLIFSAWLDQGAIPGFQNGGQNPNADPTEGDNIRQEPSEPLIITAGPIDAANKSYLLSQALAATYATADCQDPDGDTAYGSCHGLAQDGRMVESAVYYFGLDWNLPLAVGNEIQNDQLLADLEFQVVQHQNNPTQTF